MKMLIPAVALACLLGAQPWAHAATFTATFDDLPTPPALDSATGLLYANGGSNSVYGGVLWDSRFRVAGNGYRIEPPAGPLFGIPNSGDYFVTNEGAGASNDGLQITTSTVLTGAWFGRNEYYGFGAGADRVTIQALSGATVLTSVDFDLPEKPLGLPGPLGFADTSSFASFAGSITGYRINRRPLEEIFGGSWVADDFTFVAATPVPEPEAAWMLLGGLALLAAWRRRG